MPKNTPIHVRVQPPEDFIDFPVSDTYRDHYAAQGLTHPSGRYHQKTRSGELIAAQRESSVWKQQTVLARQEADDLKCQKMRLQARVVELEQEVLRLQRNPQTVERYAATSFEPVVVGGN